MPARWARGYFQELPSPCFREGVPGTHAPHSAWQLPIKRMVPWQCHLYVTDTRLRGEHPPCLWTTVAVALRGAEPDLGHQCHP